MRSCVERLGRSAGGEMYAVSGLADGDEKPSNQQRQNRDRPEVHQRLDGQPADFLEIRVPGNAYHQSSKQQRRNNNLDQAQKDRAQELQLDGEGGSIVSEFDSGEQSDENPGGERAAGCRPRGDADDGEPAQTSRDDDEDPRQFGSSEECGHDRDGRKNSGGEGEFVLHWRASEQGIIRCTAVLNLSHGRTLIRSFSPAGRNSPKQ